MSVYDRPYMRDDSGPSYGGEGGGTGGGGISWGLPKLTPVVKWLLIINVVVFIIQSLVAERYPEFNRFFGVSVSRFWAVWTYLTFQFLHGGIGHILLNMAVLYFIGTTLEQLWGGRAFLRFYLGCGAAAGLLFVIISAISQTNPNSYLIGASGGVFGLLLACAICVPQFRLVFLFFPVPIRPAAVVIFGIMIFTVLSAFVNGNTQSALSDVAHLGGALAAAFRIWVWPALRGQKIRSQDANPAANNKGAWKRRMEKEAADEREVDRILEKIQQEGIGSLSDRERKTLQQATARQREKDRSTNNTFKNR